MKFEETLKKFEEELKAQSVEQYKYEVDKLLGTIPEKLLEELSKRNAMIAGGSVLSTLTGNPVNDIDMYFKSEEDMALSIDACTEYKYICASWTSKSCVFVSPNGATLNFIMFKTFKDLDEVFESFDFTCVMAGINVKDRSIEMHKDFMKDNLRKRLVYSAKNYYPMGTIYRIPKYEAKGYSISRKELAKIMVKILDVEIKTVEDLEDQLGTLYGIDLKEVFKGIETLDTGKILDRLENISSSELYGEAKIEHVSVTAEKFAKRFYDIIESKTIEGYSDRVSMIDGEPLCMEFEKGSTKEVLCKIVYPMYFYKVVSNDLSSFHEKTFKYNLLDYVDGGLHGIYGEDDIFKLRQSIYWSRYKNESHGKVLELKVEKPEDIISHVSSIANKTRIRRAFVTRIVEDLDTMKKTKYEKIEEENEYWETWE